MESVERRGEGSANVAWPVDGRDPLEQALPSVKLMPDVFPRPDCDLEQPSLLMLLRQLVGPLLHGGVSQSGGGEDEPGEFRLEAPRRFDFRLQLAGSDLGPQAPVLLLALHTHNRAVLVAEDVHPILTLAAPAILLRIRVLPDVLPQVEAERLKGGRVVRRFPSFNVGTHRCAYGGADSGRLPLQFRMRGPWPCP